MNEQISYVVARKSNPRRDFIVYRADEFQRAVSTAKRCALAVFKNRWRDKEDKLGVEILEVRLVADFR